MHLASAIALVLAQWAPAPARAQEQEQASPAISAEITPSKKPKETVREVEWLETKTPVEVTRSGARITLLTRIRIRYRRPGWSLVYTPDGKTSPPKPDEAGTYVLEAKLTGESTRLRFFVVGPLGEVQTQIATLRVSEYSSTKRKAEQKRGNQGLIFASAGLTSISYRETGTPDLSQIVSTVKVAYTILIMPPRWDFGVNAFVNAFPLSTNRPGVWARFIGVNVRFGYVVPLVKSPWRLSVLTGLYYSRLIASGDDFGYSPLMFPQLYPILRRTLGEGDAAYLYLKFVPTGKELGISLTERELAAGAGYERFFASIGKPLSLSLDYSDLRFKGSATRSVGTHSVSLSVGYPF